MSSFPFWPNVCITVMCWTWSADSALTPPLLHHLTLYLANERLINCVYMYVHSLVYTLVRTKTMTVPFVLNDVWSMDPTMHPGGLFCSRRTYVLVHHRVFQRESNCSRFYFDCHVYNKWCYVPPPHPDASVPLLVSAVHYIRRYVHTYSIKLIILAIDR